MDLKQYELALLKHYKTQNIKTMPLVSWDFYSIFLHKTTKSLKDANLATSIIQKYKGEIEWSLLSELQDDTIIVVTDTNLKIVFASNNMVSMNGYKPEEVIGNTPKMFQGKLTDETTSKEISIAVKNRQSFEKTIINYCKDGSIYKCNIKGFPIFNANGELTNFIAFEKIAA